MNEAAVVPVLESRGLAKTYSSGPLEVPVLAGIDLVVAPGERIAIVGASGSGKSTLLHLIGTLERPSGGTIEIDGRDPYGLPEPELARFRNAMVGFVFQDHHLLPQCSVLENVLIPTLAGRGASDGDADRARELLSHEELFSNLYDRLPKEMIFVRQLLLSALFRSPARWEVSGDNG